MQTQERGLAHTRVKALKVHRQAPERASKNNSQRLSMTCQLLRRCCANESQHTLPGPSCCLAECHIIQILPLLRLLPAEKQPRV